LGCPIFFKEKELSLQPLVEMKNITKRFLSVTANDRVNLVLEPGQVIALLGENGAGKTTLMNVLYGYYQPEEGEIIIDGIPVNLHSPKDAIDRGIAMIHQHFTLVPSQTVLENVMIGMEDGFFLNPSKAKKRLLKIQEEFGLNLDPDAFVWTLSVGEQQKLEILKSLYRQARILIMDEPTAVLAPTETIELFKTLKKLVATGHSIIFISHHLQEVMEISNKVLVLRNGLLVAERDTPNTNIKELATLMVGRELLERLNRGDGKPGEAVMEVSSLNARNHRNIRTLQDISFTLKKGEILGVAGVSGNGQSELAKVLFGLEQPESGTLIINGETIPSGSPASVIHAGMGRIPEDRISTGLCMDLSISENLVLEQHSREPFSSRGLLKHSVIKEFAGKCIDAFSIKSAHSEIAVKSLSGGNLQKVILARELSGNPKVVVASQPTRGLDVGAMEYVHQSMLDEKKLGAGVLLISDDLDEIFLLSDRIIVLYGGKIMGEISADKADRDTIGLWMSGVES